MYYTTTHVHVQKSISSRSWAGTFIVTSPYDTRAVCPCLCLSHLVTRSLQGTTPRHAKVASISILYIGFCYVLEHPRCISRLRHNSNPIQSNPVQFSLVQLGSTSSIGFRSVPEIQLASSLNNINVLSWMKGFDSHIPVDIILAAFPTSDRKRHAAFSTFWVFIIKTAARDRTGEHPRRQVTRKWKF